MGRSRRIWRKRRASGRTPFTLRECVRERKRERERVCVRERVCERVRGTEKRERERECVCV